MKHLFAILFYIGSLPAQEAGPSGPSVPDKESPTSDVAPGEEVTDPTLTPAKDPEKLFQKSFELGRSPTKQPALIGA